MRLLSDPLKKILDFIVYSNLFISLCVAFATFQTAIIFSKNSDQIFFFILPNFIATFVLYNLQRLYNTTTQSDNAKYIWHSKNKRLIFTLIFLLVFCSFNLLWEFFFDDIKVLFGYAALAVLSLFYFLPPIQLRKYGMFKPFIIAFVLTCVSVILPQISEFNKTLLIYAFGQFCFISALCVLFDIRDVENDKESKFTTLPIKYGLTKAKYITLFLLIMYLTSAVFTPYTNYLLVVIITMGLSLALTIIAKPNQHSYFYLFLVDGCIIAQCLLLLIQKNG
jgi:4-hydroxybenzoate polyprenyltransferase